jgi:hypothetical protein
VAALFAGQRRGHDLSIHINVIVLYPRGVRLQKTVIIDTLGRAFRVFHFPFLGQRRKLPVNVLY